VIFLKRLKLVVITHQYKPEISGNESRIYDLSSNLIYKKSNLYLFIGCVFIIGFLNLHNISHNTIHFRKSTDNELITAIKVANIYAKR
jgi:hypothetical protein